ncbi:MAG: hypothetical protein Q4C58_13090 [Eubacteriales bacterium]|nr:hypothetical protein [Eubacteriales bacterium]
MYTVIITEQEHIDNIREYGLFLEPFMKKTQFTPCLWNPEEQNSLKESVPNLDETVAHLQEWRAVIICDEAGLNKKNPFNLVEYKEPVWEGEEKESLEAYYARRLEAKKAAYREAAKQPLTRLVTRLCEDPTVTARGDQNTDPNSLGFLTEDLADKLKATTREDLEFREYRECARYKKKLRDEIRGSEPMVSSYPKEIICIARRHHDDMDYELQCIWSEHDEREYTRFYDWNLYFDKMRYLVLDVDDKDRQSYAYDYIRFLLSVTLIAGNEAPAGCLQPNRVYQLCSVTDEDNMTELLGRYDAKLTATKDAIQAKISAIRTKPVERLSDDAAEKIFCANITIPVNMNQNYDREELFCREKVGLAKDSPVDDEEKIWTSSCLHNRKALKKLLKQPKRAIKKATDDFHKMDVLEEERAALLNEFQVEDVREHIDQEELRMVDTHTGNIYEADQYYKELEKGYQKVLSMIDQRMRKKTTLLLGAAVLGSILIGMIPAFFMNRADSDTLYQTVILAVVALGLVALCAFICLLGLRNRLREEISDYNGTVGTIVREVEDCTGQYSVYLSHACNIMRGNSVLSYHKNHQNGAARQIMILKKHAADMEERQAVLRDIFGRFLRRSEMIHKYEEAPYDYDFTRAVDYQYPLPATPHLRMQIEFLERGNYIEIPYGIVKKMELRREELYD